jgi:hypothetical protein
MTQMITVNDNEERIQAHKGEQRRTSERWLNKTQLRHVYDRVATKEIRRLVHAGGQHSKDKRVSKQHYYQISFPKNYCKEFGLSKGSLFCWSVAQEQL